MYLRIFSFSNSDFFNNFSAFSTIPLSSSEISFKLIYNNIMNKLISVTGNAVSQIKKILSNAPIGMDALVVGIDKSGCSGYSYKLDSYKNVLSKLNLRK